MTIKYFVDTLQDDWSYQPDTNRTEPFTKEWEACAYAAYTSKDWNVTKVRAVFDGEAHYVIVVYLSGRMIWHLNQSEW